MVVVTDKAFASFDWIISLIFLLCKGREKKGVKK